MSGALGVAVLVLVLGPKPDQASFGWAFTTTAAVAAAGAVVGWFGLARRSAARPVAAVADPVGEPS
jgi:purine-cytosine permease-like protein